MKTILTLLMMAVAFPAFATTVETPNYGQIDPDALVQRVATLESVTADLEARLAILEEFVTTESVVAVPEPLPTPEPVVKAPVASIQVQSLPERQPVRNVVKMAYTAPQVTVQRTKSRVSTSSRRQPVRNFFGGRVRGSVFCPPGSLT